MALWPGYTQNTFHFLTVEQWPHSQHSPLITRFISTSQHAVMSSLKWSQVKYIFIYFYILDGIDLSAASKTSKCFKNLLVKGANPKLYYRIYIVASVPVLSIVWKKSLNANKLVAVDGGVDTAKAGTDTANHRKLRGVKVEMFGGICSPLLWLATVEMCPWLAACSHFRLFSREAWSWLRGLVTLVEVAFSELLRGFSPQNNLLIYKINR